MKTHILVLEDEVDFREGIVELLKIEGFISHGVSSLHELKQWLLTNHCDILILDRNLPDGDGLDALGFISDSNRSGSIILTCEGETQDRITEIISSADYTQRKNVYVIRERYEYRLANIMALTNVEVSIRQAIESLQQEPIIKSRF